MDPQKEKYSWGKWCDCGENKRRADYHWDEATKQLTPVWICINCNKETTRIVGPKANVEQTLQRKLERASWLARQVLDALPQKRDWLDPALEAELKDLGNAGGGTQ
jgi:hypothetical protein